MKRKLAKVVWKSLAILAWVLLTISILINLYQRQYYITKTEQIEHAQFLLISKQDLSIRLIDYKGDEQFQASIACGKRFGNKQKIGDMRTPEGIFQVQDIQNASGWKHDFKDGKGEIEGAYGPYFIRLLTPGHKGIGIHGTHDSLSIGSKVTEGCIRLENDKLMQLVKLIHPPLTVIITPSSEDVSENIDNNYKNVSNKNSTK